MAESTDTYLYKARFVTGGLLIIGGLALLPFLLSFIFAGPSVQATRQSSSATIGSLEDSPNVITGGLVSTVTGLEQAARAAENTISSGAQVVAAGVADSGKRVVGGVASGASRAGNAVATGLTAAVRIPAAAVEQLGDGSLVGALIRPGSSMELPVINIHDHATETAPAAVLVAQSAAGSSPSESLGSWPIHGKITARFGVPHWPYQPIHSGIDISTGGRSGTVPVKPFKPGRVTETVQSRVSLGNHVVIDHGGGITSVYAHLHSILVQVGQSVDQATTLGYEGSTGASTGTHLHFEIRVNGSPVNPQQFLDRA